MEKNRFVFICWIELRKCLFLVPFTSSCTDKKIVKNKILIVITNWCFDYLKRNFFGGISSLWTGGGGGWGSTYLVFGPCRFTIIGKYILDWSTCSKERTSARSVGWFSCRLACLPGCTILWYSLTAGIPDNLCNCSWMNIWSNAILKRMLYWVCNAVDWLRTENLGTRGRDAHFGFLVSNRYSGSGTVPKGCVHISGQLLAYSGPIPKCQVWTQLIP